MIYIMEDPSGSVLLSSYIPTKEHFWGIALYLIVSLQQDCLKRTIPKATRKRNNVLN